MSSVFGLLLSAACGVFAQTTLTASEAAMARAQGIDPNTMTAEQLQQARSALGGRDPSTLSASEIAAAKQALKGAQTRLPDTSRQKLDNLDRRLLDTLGVDSLKVADSLFRAKDSLPFGRYEDFLFSHVMPSAFYEKQGAVSAEYPIKADDQLVLSLWGAVEKEYSLKVNSQGKVFVEGIGLVSLNGLTLGQAEKMLKAKLSSVYAGIGQGRISLNLRPEALAANKVFVVGEVKRPGGYDLPSGSNVFLALYRALGPNASGSVRNIVVRSAAGDSVKVDLYSLLFQGKRADQAVLRDGDVLFVPRAEKLVKVQGGVVRPAIYELTKTEGVAEALSYAGGLLPNAGASLSLWHAQEDGRLEVNNLENAKSYLQSAGKSEPMTDGDSLFVPLSTVESREFVEVVGAAWYPGAYKFQQGLTVKQYVDMAGGLKPDGYDQRVVIQRIQPDSTFAYLADSYAQPTGVALLPKDRLIVLSLIDLNSSREVRVAGAVNNDTSVYWQPGLTVKNMIALAKGFAMNHQNGVIQIERLVPGKDEIQVLTRKLRSDLTLEETPELTLLPGDRVVVPVDPTYYEQELVTVAGAVRNPGTFALAKNRESVYEFVNRTVTFDANAFLKGGRLYRLRGEKYYLVTFDFDKAVAGKLEKSVTLMHGDSLFIPEQQLTVQIKGEVVSPGDVLWVKGWDIDDYLNAAGGLTLTGDEDRIVVTYANGRKSNRDRAERDPDPGSVIEVAYIKPPDPIKWTEIVSAFGTVITGIAAFVIAYATFSGRTN